MTIGLLNSLKVETHHLFLEHARLSVYPVNLKYFTAYRDTVSTPVESTKTLS